MNTEGRTILLVEDDELLALTESRWLKKAGYKLFHAATGEKAVSIAGDPNQKIDLILMDINLGPGMDGTDAARAILRKNDIPILFLSSHTEKEVVKKTEEITSYGYVVKDSKEVVLLASIKMAFKLHDANKKLSENEEALQESEAKFRSIFEQAPVGMLLLSPSGEFLNVNKSLCELFGYSEEQLLKMTFKDLTYPDDVEESGAWIERLVSNEAASVDFEKRYVTKSGTIIHAIVRTILRRNAEGLPLYFISHIQDITERKRAESEIISKNRDLAALLDTSQALASTLEMQTILQIIIEKAVELIGLDTGAIYLLNDLGLYLGATTPPLPEDFPEIFRHTQLIDHPNIAKAISVHNPIVITDISKGEFSPAEKLIVEGRGLGSILYLPIFLGKEAVGILLLGTVNRSRTYSDSEIDSYRTMAYQAALTIDNARLYRKVQNQIREPKFDLEQYLIKDIALQSSLSAIGLADMNGNLIYANDSYYSMWECRPEEVIGKNLSETAKLEGREMLEEVMNSILNGDGYFGECPAFKKDGTPFYVQMAANIVTSPVGERICMMASFIDITERKNIQEQLQDSEAKFRLFFESNSAAMAIIEPDTTISLVNDAYCRMSGYSKEEITGKSWTEQIPAKDLERLKEYNRKRLINPKDAPEKYEFTFYHKNGDIKNGLMSVGMISGEKKIIASFTDITEQKQTEKELESSLSILETTLESTIDGILVVNENGEITRYNKKFVEQWRIPEEILATGDDEKAIGFVLDQLKNPKKFVSKVNELYERPLEVSFDVLEFKDGRVFERYSQPQLFAGQSVGRVWSFRDITERMKSELIQKAFSQISEAAHNTPDSQTLYKKIHEVISTLMPAKNFYIALYDEKSGMLSFPYMVDEFDPHYESKKLGKGLTEYVMKIGKASLIDAERDIELRNLNEVELIGTPAAVWLGAPLIIGKKSIGVIAVQDYQNRKAYSERDMQLLTFVSEQIAVTIERKRDSDAIVKFTEELEELNRSKDKFFSIISHDLKNPFHSINSALSILLDEYEDLTPDERTSFLRGALNTSNKAYALLDNLLIWSKAQMGKMEFIPEKIKLIEIVENNIELFSNNACLKNITLVNNVFDNIFVTADKNMLDTVIRNLIGNAIKYTPDRGKVEIGSQTKDDSVEITVTDNGVGIEKEDITKLFRIDKLVSRPGTKGENGTGLGLILCQEFIKKNGGMLRVESKVNQGSQFSFTLPLQK